MSCAAFALRPRVGPDFERGGGSLGGRTLVDSRALGLLGTSDALPAPLTCGEGARERDSGAAVAGVTRPWRMGVMGRGRLRELASGGHESTRAAAKKKWAPLRLPCGAGVGPVAHAGSALPQLRRQRGLGGGVSPLTWALAMKGSHAALGGTAGRPQEVCGERVFAASGRMGR